jgi:N-acetylmuramoyl-L-alanine amidase
VVRDVDESALAATANAAGAACLVVLRLDPGTSRSTALYFASERSQSPAGMLLAQHVAEATGKALALDHAVAGMTLPVLRETQMPAVVVEFGPLDRVVERTAQLAAAVVEALEGWTAPRA